MWMADKTVLIIHIITNQASGEAVEFEMIGHTPMYYAHIITECVSKKNKKYKSSDFFKIKKKQKKQSADEMVNILSAFTLSMEGEVNL